MRAAPPSSRSVRAAGCANLARSRRPRGGPGRAGDTGASMRVSCRSAGRDPSPGHAELDAAGSDLVENSSDPAPARPRHGLRQPGQARCSGGSAPRSLPPQPRGRAGRDAAGSRASSGIAALSTSSLARVSSRIPISTFTRSSVRRSTSRELLGECAPAVVVEEELFELVEDQIEVASGVASAASASASASESPCRRRPRQVRPPGRRSTSRRRRPRRLPPDASR